MNYLIAVSGGVDSVVLLDKLVKNELPYSSGTFIVAHFDHGIRPDSAADAVFVRELAEHYGLAFETAREELGVSASEELARDRRYVFLRSVAKKHNARIVTAHHADDIVETIAINLTRGTGWRGLAVLNSSDIERPLLDTSKAQLIEYAKSKQLTWREDSTNSDTKYLRNDLRQKLVSLDDDAKQLLLQYHERQVYLGKEIVAESKDIVGQSPYARYLFIAAHELAATELLREVLMVETGVAPVRPQLHRALLAIKTYVPGKTYEVARGTKLRFTQTTFVVEVTPPVLS